MTTTALLRAVLLACAITPGVGACGERAESDAAPKQSGAQGGADPARAPDFDWRSVVSGDPIETRDLGDGLIIRILSVGEAAAPVVLAGDTVEIEFRASHFAKDAAPVEFDSSTKRGGPMRVPLIEGSAVPGLLRGLEGLRVGDVARIEIPSELGYGSAGRGPIPANATLVFEVWVRAIQR